MRCQWSVRRGLVGWVLAVVVAAGCTSSESRSEQLAKHLQAANVCTSVRRVTKRPPGLPGVSLRDTSKCRVTPSDDVTVWVSPDSKGPTKLIAAIRNVAAGSKDCIPLPAGVNPDDVNTNVQMVVGKTWVASADKPEITKRVHVVLGGRIVNVIHFDPCGP